MHGFCRLSYSSEWSFANRRTCLIAIYFPRDWARPMSEQRRGYLDRYYSDCTDMICVLPALCCGILASSTKESKTWGKLQTDTTVLATPMLSDSVRCWDMDFACGINVAFLRNYRSVFHHSLPLSCRDALLALQPALTCTAVWLMLDSRVHSSGIGCLINGWISS